ncbi:FAD-binding oxidoreductase [Pseudonocardia charpentierae]|uniref:FAD-binding oxidoreductase n=1 Tax=Pseudonocardia charpentierae TaxID=3075545 RepID=A0ABU2NAY4_9PSEU|nr:FAD-binding oxidoreductase [Pseudonocardia sp. DSM 45834]MDT0351110.1 FAD-binding oxidoreductase [Pseudonocardia sp. DSM 45834]
MAAPTDITADVIRPDDPGYDDARAVFNAMIDRRPLAIVRCRDARDVAAGIRYARDHDLVLSVRGGGHGVAGNAVCDGGIMLDLSSMKNVTVDPAQRTAHAGPGLLLGELDAATQRFGLATPLGVMSGTGIAGLTLGGGLGWCNSRYGLTCDNLIGAEVVTADGDIVHVGPDEHPDLLWGLRGGGGNLAVVTSFIYRLHPVSSVLAGALTHPWVAARDVLRHHHAFMASAPDELASAVSLGLDAAGAPAVTIIVCWSGDPAEGERVLRPLRSFGPPIGDSIGVLPYLDWQRTPDPGFPRGRLHYWKSGYLRHLTDAALDALLAIVPTIPTPAVGIGLQGLRGAAARVPVDATAFPHRAEQYDLLILAQWSDPARTDEHVGWTRAAFDALRPHLEDAVYVNNLGTEGPGRVRSAYGPNHARLAALKHTYDPANVFRLNQNVPPG